MPKLFGMDFSDFLTVAAATFVGGLMLAAFLWAGWKSVQMEKRGVGQTEFPFRVYVFLILPLALVAGVVFYNL